jgi:hypothetical protein
LRQFLNRRSTFYRPAGALQRNNTNKHNLQDSEFASIPPLNPKDPFLGKIDCLHALFVTTGRVGMMAPGQSSPGIEDLLFGSV